MIVVTGMHRSGTSSIAHLLQELGVPLGDAAGLLPADRWNAKGYFEQRDVLDLNSRIVTGFPYCRGWLRRRLSQLVYATHPGLAARRRRFAGLRDEVERLGANYAGVAVKDPRFCLTLQLWREAVEIEGCVVCIRNPAESVGSLHRRQGYPLRRGWRFWDYHIEALLDALEGLRVHVVDYGALLGEEPQAELDALAAFFGVERDAAQRRAALERAIEPELRHVVREGADPLPATTRRLWSRLEALARAG